MVKTDFLKNKYGFSLVEALVVMTIAAIFVAVIATVVPHKSKPKLSAEAHGGFECYWVGEQLYSRVITIGSEGIAKAETGDHCVFRPNQYINYLIFNTVGGGAFGNTEDGGSAGQYTSAFISTPQKSYNLYPGKGGTNSHHDGYNSLVKVGSDTIVEVKGGNDVIRIEDSKFEDILEVYQAGKLDSSISGLGCVYTPRAWLGSDKKIHVSYCANSADIVEKTLEYENSSYIDDNAKYNTVITSPVVKANNGSSVLSKKKDGTNNIWEYYDVGIFLDTGYQPHIQIPSNCTFSQITSMNNAMCPSRYKIEIVLNISDNGDDGAVSELTKYADLMKYDNLKAIGPGNGGKKGNQPGNPGAILVSW